MASLALGVSEAFRGPFWLAEKVNRSHRDRKADRPPAARQREERPTKTVSRDGAAR